MVLTAEQLRRKRVQAGISGAVVCKHAKIGRTKLSEIERGLVTPSTELLNRLEAVLADLIRMKRKMAALAEEEGWPLPISGSREL